MIINNNLSEQEVEQTAGNRSVVEEVLTAIARRREWVEQVQRRQGPGPEPPDAAGDAMRLVTKLSVRDLRDLGRDRNIPDAVRSTALRLYRIKQK